jgi:hypothetical protein
LGCAGGRGWVEVSSGYRRLVPVSFKVDEDLLRELNEVARSMGMCRSEVIRRAVAWYVKSQARPSVTPRMTIYVVGNGGGTSTGTPKIRVR